MVRFITSDRVYLPPSFISPLLPFFPFLLSRFLDVRNADAAGAVGGGWVRV